MTLPISGLPYLRSSALAPARSMYIFVARYSGHTWYFHYLWRRQIVTPRSQSCEGVLRLGGVANGVLPSHSDHLDLDEPQPLAHTLPSNRPGANDDADDDVQCWLRPSGPRNPSVQCTQGCLGTTSLPSSRRLHLPSQRQRELGTGAGLSRYG
jgi:hypothetical protein